MRTRRLLLAASALSMTFGCSKQTAEPKRDPETTQPLPGNPKGTFYDDAMVAPVAPDAAPVASDAAIASPPRDAEVLPMPGNPKGTFYDAGVVSPPPRDAAIRSPRDAAIRRVPPDGPPLKSNPKGSLYDKGHKNDPGL